MRKLLILFSVFLLLACNNSPADIEEDDTPDKVLAFPEAEGAGAYTVGGRGGLAFYVTSLEDDVQKPGTLRYILNQPGAKTVLFKVAGIIELNSPLRVKNSNLTIAGQSAPGDGICIKNYPVIIEANNVIIRFIRFRMGDEKAVEGDAITCTGRSNIIIDHCSMSWGTDECASAYDNSNFTMQWCIVSESLRNSVHGKGSHGYAGIWGGKTVSYHHNLLAHHDSRNPRFCGSRYSNDAEAEKIDFRNNVIYNWGMNSGYAGEGGVYNLVNNYYKPGPATRARGGSAMYRIFQPNSDDGSNKQPQGIWGKFYVIGNVMDENEEVTSDNWTKGIQPNIKSYDKDFDKESIKAATEFDITKYEVVHTAHEAYAAVLEKAGASFVRDVVDIRIVDEVRNNKYTYTGSNGSKNGIIDSQSDAGGWPVYSFDENKVLKDSDGDGIPDEWEDANGLNKNKASDGNEKTLDKNYTNLEVYLNSLVKHLY
ncbi:pectate lyase [Paludibacter sp. 221]|uniref:pectate lyase family protein n=1 Tax=Paludibacter sp. 221 TaxID=2302939 RepID=UPI0013D0FC95|nr:pectate lyase [Paludibacter sp. 221]NDV46972.1 pectate lyase [Paludibacter sp. 221]